MLVVCLDNLVIRGFVLLGHNDWVALEDVQLGRQLEEVALDEQVLKDSHGLLCLLQVVLLGESHELNEVWVCRDGVLLHKHCQRRDSIGGCTLGEHGEVPISILRLLEIFSELPVQDIHQCGSLFVESLGDLEVGERLCSLLDFGDELLLSSNPRILSVAGTLLLCERLVLVVFNDLLFLQGFRCLLLGLWGDLRWSDLWGDFWIKDCHRGLVDFGVQLLVSLLFDVLSSHFYIQD